MKKYIVGITGASGSIYGFTLVKELLALGHEVYLIVTEQGKKVMAYELERAYEDLLKDLTHPLLQIEDNQNFFSSVASGSFKTDGMIIAPCSMGSLGKIAHGTSDALLHRAADVMLKEHRPLILLTRETPLSTLHLKNMLAVSEVGGLIMPPLPAFYHLPKTLHDLVLDTTHRILATLGLAPEGYKSWENPL